MHARWVPDFDVPGALRRIRRLADLSQRELATALDVSKSAIAAAETGDRGIEVAFLGRAAAVAGLRLALLDAAGHEVGPMTGYAVRDLSGRRFPAHLDTRRSDERGWLYEPRRDRPETSFTFIRDRSDRDAGRTRNGTPEDHHPDRPGDSPRAREEARHRAARQRRREDDQRRLQSGSVHPTPDFECRCPPVCEQLDDWSGRPVHHENCPCRCDLG